MKKTALQETIIGKLEAALGQAIRAADEAKATATHKENVAENKYDTLGLEAAYLAHGQSERAIQLNEELAAFQALNSQTDEHVTVAVGSLVQLDNDAGGSTFFYIGPAAGGLVVSLEGHSVVIITPESPFGQTLTGRRIEDEIVKSTPNGDETLTIVGLW